MSQRRRQRRAEKHNATEAALRLAHEDGINLDDVEGTGADGRITVSDVRDAAKEEE
jgi:pyruvate/2-oxoglutarate dehydrogenase complex dihydrolipoamide acyltransferase (E2) component